MSVKMVQVFILNEIVNSAKFRDFQNFQKYINQNFAAFNVKLDLNNVGRSWCLLQLLLGSEVVGVSA